MISCLFEAVAMFCCVCLRQCARNTSTDGGAGLRGWRGEAEIVEGEREPTEKKSDEGK